MDADDLRRELEALSREQEFAMSEGNRGWAEEIEMQMNEIYMELDALEEI